ncbi:hypothetical protein FB555_002100 [Alpinimonas psychrophila]|uniref:Uncharacterized protein n=1 Tax=Alpinimonas psychrophila TaxID=748908 RepID=A0A7W3JVG6_9MICO|nr:hypothetical protein [Alpinimonas psychrophila]
MRDWPLLRALTTLLEIKKYLDVKTNSVYLRVTYLTAIRVNLNYG